MNVISTISDNTLVAAPANEYLMLAAGEVWRVSGKLRQIHVISGTAWVSSKGVDTILLAGERFSTANSGNAVVISAVNKTSLTLELVKDRR